jgi:DNA-binding MarR family transcriptional regulator
MLDPNSFGFLVTDLSRLVRAEMDRRIAEAGFGLTPAEARTLAHAARAGRVRQNALAERMGIEAMTLSGHLDRLEARGLVERRTDPADRRANLVALTDEAEAVLGNVGVTAAAIRTDASADIDPTDWARLLAMLKAARDNLVEARARSVRAKGGGEA